MTNGIGPLAREREGQIEIKDLKLTEKARLYNSVGHVPDEAIKTVEFDSLPSAKMVRFRRYPPS
ncbi:hypothetical protein ISR94_03825 [Candidatus Microgenomates bacterium]|nr:hypothetical protein [Candidatus Microgenomates bacterium]